MLSRSNFINYFGKASSLQNIEVSPLLFEKGDTKLALYGLGNVRDERLHRMFLHDQVKWVRPAESHDAWFNMAVLHQNRFRHNLVYKNCISEGFLPDFLDLIIWGHEHECRIEPELNTQKNFVVSQPGSTCRTSLCLAETGNK